jgi:hypothetical protein
MTDLTILTDAQLEDAYNDSNLTCDADLSDAVIQEILNNRPAFEPQTYDLMWELQDCGWNGGATQEDRDAR